LNRQQLYVTLQDALDHPSKRSDCIEQFQTAVFEETPSKLGLTDVEWDVVRQLAQDLDYYEPDPEARRGTPTLFGDERAVEEIRAALGRL